jgi:putative pre-16S rRNA nuclease
MIGRVLAIDYGGKRTGVAICDALGITAQPLPAIISTDLQQTAQLTVDLVKERQAQTVLIGIPFMPDGSEGDQVANVRLFLSVLQPLLPAGVAIAEIDERHTTKEAEAMWRQAGYSKRKAKEFIDSTVAVILLREYLAMHL